jgi:hypothetical protein
MITYNASPLEADDGPLILRPPAVTSLSQRRNENGRHPITSSPRPRSSACDYRPTTGTLARPGGERTGVQLYLFMGRYHVIESLTSAL